MTSERPVVLGISSRRSACDRCRGQKLRCLRDRGENRCRRCARAEVQCVTSSIFRMRNFVSDDATIRPRRRHHSHQPQVQPRSSTANATTTTSAAAVASTAKIIDLATVLADPVPTSIFTNHDAGRSSSDKSREPSHPQAALTTAVLEHLPRTNCASTVSSVTSPSYAADRLEAWRPMNSKLFNFVLFPETPSLEASKPVRGNNNSLMNNQTQGSLALNLVSQPTLSMHPTDLPGFLELDHVGRDGLTMELDFQGALSPHSEKHGVQATENYVEKAQETHTQKLLQVNSLLLTLGSRLDQVDGATTTLIEDIVYSTNKFLDVLGSMAGPSQSRFLKNIASSADSSPASNPELNIKDLRVGSGSSAKQKGNTASLADDNQLSLTSSVRHTLDVNANPANDNLDPDLNLEITTQLVILTCYLQILQLFVVLLSHIQDYLEEVATSDDPSIGPIPGLSFISRFPLESGNIQATLFIQIVTSLFQRVEKLLGLPRDLRVNTHGRDHCGLLSDKHFVEILKVVMQKEEAGLGRQVPPGSPPKRGLESINALRSSMKRAKQLLRDSITP